MTQQIAKGRVVLGKNFKSHRIKGYVPHAARRGIDPNLDVPLISKVDLTGATWPGTKVTRKVKGRLWQGGCMDGVQLPSGFNFVLSLYPWEKYALHPHTQREEIRMYDSLDQGFGQVEEAAEKVAGRLIDGDTVLVHCQAGLNRSGLLAATILVKHLKFTPVEAIGRLRSGRSPLVLCNEAFENWIAGLV